MYIKKPKNESCEELYRWACETTEMLNRTNKESSKKEDKNIGNKNA